MLELPLNQIGIGHEHETLMVLLTQSADISFFVLTQSVSFANQRLFAPVITGSGILLFELCLVNGMLHCAFVCCLLKVIYKAFSSVARCVCCTL